MRSMLRLLQGISLAAACFTLFGGCAQHPPLDQQTQIPVDLLWPHDRLQQDKIVYGELADNQKILPVGTIEIDYKDQFIPDNRDPCRSFRTALQCTFAFFWPVMVLPVTIVALPFVAANEVSKAPDKPDKEEAQTPWEKHANWLASGVMEGQFSSALDDAYISSLNQALGWEVPPITGMVEQQYGEPTSASAARRLRAGISQVVLLDSNLGEQRLILCARSLVQRGQATARYFETCQSWNIELALPHDSPARGEALRAVLLNQARQLAALQAKALTEQTKFVRGANR